MRWWWCRRWCLRVRWANNTRGYVCTFRSGLLSHHCCDSSYRRLQIIHNSNCVQCCLFSALGEKHAVCFRYWFCCRILVTVGGWCYGHGSYTHIALPRAGVRRAHLPTSDRWWTGPGISITAGIVARPVMGASADRSWCCAC